MADNKKRDSFREELESKVVLFDEITLNEYLDAPPVIMTLEEKKEWEKKLKQEIKRALKEHITDERSKKQEKAISEEKDKPKDDLVDLGTETEDLAKSEDIKEDNVSSDTEKAYLDKSQIIHDLKMKMYKEQINKHTMTPNKEIFYKILELEKENKYLRRDIKEPSDKLKEQESQNIKSEMEYEKRIRDVFMVKAKRVDRLSFELKECNDKIADLKKFQLDRTTRPEKAFDADEYKKRIDDYEAKRLNVLIAIYLENPKLMEEEILETKELKLQRKRALDPADAEKIAILSDDAKGEITDNSRYAMSREQKATKLIENVNSFMQKEEDKELINARESIERLEIERKKLPKNPTSIEDIEKVTAITRQLADLKQVEENLETGSTRGELDPKKQIQEANKDTTDSYDNRQKVNNSLNKINEVIKEVKQETDEQRLENPTKTTKETAGNLVKHAAVGYSVAGGTKGEVAVGAMLFREGLREKINDPETIEGAEKIVEAEDSIDKDTKKQISKDLESAERKVEKM